MTAVTKIKQSALWLIAICVLGAFSSCGGNNSNDDVFNEITGYKWSIDPYKCSDGTHLDIEISPYVDKKLYLAFNDDSTVDCFENDNYMTGIFSIDGDLVTCLFVDNQLSEIAHDGDYNEQIVLKYKDNRLYMHDYLYRYKKDNQWKSKVEMSPENRELYYSNAGQYRNEKYNAGFYHDTYDTTADALCVVQRFNWRTETTFKNAKRNGIFKKYINNNISVFGSYTDGMPSGNWYFFAPNGELTKELSDFRPLSIEIFAGYKYEAKAIEYDTHTKRISYGKVYCNNNFDTREVGSWKYYNKDGNLIEELEVD